MNQTAKKTYSSRFKAKVALEANSNQNVKELSHKYSVPVAKIEAWKHELNDRAELLFVNGKESTQPELTHAALLRNVIEASPNGIVVTDLNREVITYNKKSLEMWGLPNYVTSRNSLKKVMPSVGNLLKNPQEYERIVDQSYKTPEQQTRDILELKDGRFFERISVPYYASSEIIGRVINFVDITPYKKTEEQLGKFGNLLNSVTTNVNEGILRSTPDDGLVYVNEAFVSIFGYSSKEEVLTTDPSQFYADEKVRHMLVQKLKDEKQFKNEEVLFRRKDGSTFWGLENSILVSDSDGIQIDGVITNIDNRKKAEEALKKNEEKYRTILKNIEEGYFETNLKGDFTFFNSALVGMMGYPAGTMIGMNYREFMDRKNARKVFETFNRVFHSGKSERGFGWRLTCNDESKIDVEASVTLRKDSDGEPIGFSGVVRDITERKRKQKKIQDSLKEKEVLLGEIHHRVKNNLAVISGLLYLQAEKTGDGIAKKALKQSQNRINSMALIHELLYDNKSFSSINPDLYIKQLVNHISSNLAIGECSISTTIEVDDFDLEMNTAIPCALIINELITNAYKYAFEGREEGAISIVFKKKDSGDYLLEVSDNGAGMPEGFQLDDNSQHSLGLSLVKTLTRQLKGELCLTKNKGAGFKIEFPARH